MTNKSAFRRSDWVAPTILVLIALAAWLVLCLLASCSSDPPPCVRYGQIVKARLDGRLGMVVAIYPSVFLVRFPGPQIITDTHTLGPDEPVKIMPYADVYMRCFEIE